MKNNKDRMFAYTLAKTIENEELAKVSGGSGKADITYTTTVKATGGSGPITDGAIDQSVDW